MDGFIPGVTGRFFLWDIGSEMNNLRKKFLNGYGSVQNEILCVVNQVQHLVDDRWLHATESASNAHSPIVSENWNNNQAFPIKGHFFGIRLIKQHKLFGCLNVYNYSQQSSQQIVNLT